MTRAAEVIVVGAGSSGLRLAGILSWAGISAALPEARDRGSPWFWPNEGDVLEVIAECRLEGLAGKESPKAPSPRN